MKKIVLLFGAMLCFLSGYTQNATTATIRWHVTDVFNVTGNAHEGSGDKLVVYPGARIDWQDANDNPKFSFGITSVIGTWDNVNENGLIHFNIEYSGQPGEVVVQRSAGMLSAEIRLYQVDANEQAYALQIDSYTVL